MLDRRTFTALMAGATIAPKTSWGQPVTAKTVFYAGVGPDLTLYDMDVDAATLTRRGTVSVRGNVQYAWPHPSKRYLYVVSTNGAPGGGDAPRGDTHVATIFRIDPMTGALTPHGAVANLPSRPIHTSLDATGQYLLTAYNDPSNVTVHRLNEDGTIREQLNRASDLDTGIYAHQIRTTPGNRTAIVVTRGNNATASQPEDPGALKVYAFDNGRFRNLQSVTAGNNGLGFGPRHLDFHPTKPWVYVSIERQNQLYVYALSVDGTLSPEPLFVKDTLAGPREPGVAQGAGTIHIHPNGRFAYVPNRAAGTIKIEGKDVFAGGENNIAVFAINQDTGELTAIQHIDGRGIQLRTFGIDRTGRLLVAASIQSMLWRRNAVIETLSSGLSVYRIGADGRLEFARKYDVDTSRATQFWSGMVTLA